MCRCGGGEADRIVSFHMAFSNILDVSYPADSSTPPSLPPSKVPSLSFILFHFHHPTCNIIMFSFALIRLPLLSSTTENICHLNRNKQHDSKVLAINTLAS